MMMLSRSAWTKVAVGVAAVVIVYCMLQMVKCNCKSGHSASAAYGKLKLRPQMPTAIPVVTAVPLPRPEKFAPYEPEEDEAEEYYADYVPPEDYTDYPDTRETYVDAGDVYSPPEYQSTLLE